MLRKLLVLLGVSLVVTPLAAPLVRAASVFASPAFEARWGADEAKSGNFWGPLALAKDGQQEAYAEATGGMRTVQYFDKGRMELAADGTVTSGLLAQELISGRVQTGDATFTSRTPYDYPVVGDPRNSGLTYARINRAPEFTAPTLLGDTDIPVIGYGTEQDVTRATEQLNATMYGGQRVLAMPIYDDATRHHVERVFADYREKVGFANVGYAVTRTIYEVVPIGGKRTTVLYQIFQRRVLTFTPDNPPAFQIEMGNIGQHYFQWRYGALAASAPASAAAPPAASDMGQVFADPAGRFRVTLPPGWRGPNAGSTSPNLTLTGRTPMGTVTSITVWSRPTNLSALPDDPAALLRTAASKLIIGNNVSVSGDYGVAIGDGVTFTTPTEVLIGGEQGKQFAYTVNGGRAPIYGRAYVAIHLGQAYVFLGSSSDPNHPGLDAIIRSLVFTP